MLTDGRQGRMADRVDDRDRGEKTRDDREQDRGAHADQSDERDREQRATDRAEVVHRALETVGAAIDRGRDYVGEQRVARRDPQPARRPGTRAQHCHLPCGAGSADQPGEHRRGRVAADRDRASAARVIGKRAATEPSSPSQTICDPLNHPKRGRRSPQRAR